MPRIKKSPKENAMANLLANIDFFKTYYGYSDEKVAAVLGMCAATYSTRKNNPATFKIGELIKLASSFNCTLADLVSIRRGEK